MIITFMLTIVILRYNPSLVIVSRGSPASQRHVGGRPSNFVVSAPCTALP
jgi:hypothetical protein